jgi:hypothetical protein
MKHRITTQTELRRQFWRDHPHLDRKKIIDYSGAGTMYATDTRCAWVDYIDALCKNREISPMLADRATL